MTRRLLALLAAAAIVAGCGVVEDESPRVLAPEAVPEGLLEPVTTTVPTTLPAETDCVRVYLVDADDRLVPVPRQVERPATPARAVRSLFEPMRRHEEARGLRSSIPSGTTAQVPAGQQEGLVTIDASDELLDATGESRRRALAQIVYTVTSLPDVDRVQILIEGENRALQDGTGATKEAPLRPSDYPGFARAAPACQNGGATG